MTSEGHVLSISSFDYLRTGTEEYTSSGLKSWLGWRLSLENGEELIIQLLLQEQSNPSSHTPAYWEGLTEIPSGTRIKLGYAVVEITAPAQ